MTKQSKFILFTALFVCVSILASIPFFLSQREGDSITAGFDSEFLVRPDGYPGLMEAYNFRFASPPRHMDPGLMYKAVADGTVDVICGFATDGRIPAYNLTMLHDDRNFFPPYFAAPLVRNEIIEQYPDLKHALNKLAGRLFDTTMQRLNYQVDEKKQPAAAVAKTFLHNRGIIDTAAALPAPSSEGVIRIGGKNFTEQEILGELMALCIEHSTGLTVERKLNLGGTMICFNALTAGDLDCYAEYTGTGLVSILKHEVITDPDSAYELVKKEFDDRYNVHWCKPLGFNNTYTLTMREEQARELGITSISDLAEVVRSRDEGKEE